MKKIFALLLMFSLLLSGCGCRPMDLMAGTTARSISVVEVPGGNAAATAFALRLFLASFEDGENTLVSPLSILTALGMTANGAEGNTLAQIEQALGLSTADLNAWLYAYLESQSQERKLANSIWFTDDPGFYVEQEFLETNASFYQADLYQAAFDSDTLTAINDWGGMETDGMIPEILEELPEDAVMYLINALAFQADWADIYREKHFHQPGPA